jgi:arylsulfatase A-like enzyme
MNTVKNVVLITIDCLRTDHLQTYGYERDTAPFLTELADQSMVFKNAFATGPGTFISFPSIFTGTYPFDFGGYAKLSENQTTIAEVLSNHDIRTAGIHSNTYLSRSFGYQRGFDEYETFYERPNSLIRLERVVRDRLNEERLPFQLLKRVYESVIERSNSGGASLPYERADKTTSTAIETLKKDISQPFFLWTHYMDVHAPHRPPDRHIEALGCTPSDWDAHHENWLSAKHNPETASTEDVNQFVDAYDAEIRFVDEQLSRFFDQMKQLDLHEETAYVITADHGELLGDHGQFSHPPRLYDELIHVPLLVHVPGVTDGTHDDRLVSLIDLPSTIADFFDVSTPETYRGTSLCPLLDSTNVPHEYVFSEVCHRTGEGMEKGVYDVDDAIVACRSPTAKFVRDEQRDSEEFMIVDRDGCHPEREVPDTDQEALEQAIKEHLDNLKKDNGPSETVEIDEQTAKRLRDLGYAE